MSSRSRGGDPSSSATGGTVRDQIRASTTKSGSDKLAKPAFEGAPFDRSGCCIKHHKVELAEQVREDGKLL
mgnify:CR=1 FL=1